METTPSTDAPPPHPLRRLGMLFAVLFLAVALLLGLFLSGTLGGNYALLTVKNNTHETLKSLRIELLERVYPIGELSPNTTKAVLVRDLHESHWTLHGQWPEGAPLEIEAGYLTRGTNFRDTLTIESRSENHFETHSGYIP